VEQYIIGGKATWNSEYEPIVVKEMNNAILFFAETSLGQLRDEAHAGDDNARIQFNTAIRSLIDGN